MTNGGPWGSGGGQGGGNDNDRDPNRRPGRRPGEGSPIPEIEDIMKKGSEQLRVLMGGRGPGGRGPQGSRPQGPGFSKGPIGLAVLGLVAAWAWGSFYTVQQNERSIELMFGKYHKTGNPGLNFAPWPVVTAEVIPVTDERTTELGTGRGGDMDFGPDADPRSEHRRYRISGRLEHLGPGEIPVQPGRSGRHDPRRFGIRDARHHRALGAGADPEPRPRRHRLRSAPVGAGDAGQLWRGHQCGAGELQPRRPAARGDRQLPRRAGRAAGARPAGKGGRCLCEPGHGGRPRPGCAAERAGRGLPRAGGERCAG